MNFEKATIAVPLKYLSNFWRSLRMPLVTAKFNQNLNGQNIVFCLQLAMTKLMIIIMLIILFLLSKIQNYLFQL